ncbi:hypothetical protein C8Q70DRAFT_975771 [Cubamyces menziesii]|nr:hypothetical protein C8Q70DRAFT_975771 [Cubamyces menziesii]
MASDLKQLLGEKPSSSALSEHISSLATKASKPEGAVPEVKSYSDAVYFNYYPLGLSLMFKPVNGYKPKTGLKRSDLQDENLVLDGIDIYNVPKPKAGANAARATKSPYTTYPISPIVLSLVPLPPDKDGKTRAESISITPETTGKEFVLSMGEPDRKGGGAGPSSGSIGIWCEWSKDGVMVEFGGEESRGPQAWERGKDAVWKVISIFPPKKD